MESLDSNGNVIAEGTVITLTEDAAYYDGKTVPEWVRRDTWVVTAANGDRIVLGRNTSGTNNISSPVNSRHVKVVNGAVKKEPSVMQEQKYPGQPKQKEETVLEKGSMKISDRGVELVAKYEGCRLTAYKCPAGVWTIGYGHTAGVNQGDTLDSEAEARKLLKEDLKKYGNYVNACVEKQQINFSLTQNQFDALTSFCYNCGNGSLQKLVSGRNAAEIAEKMLQYNKGGGKVLAGLVRRREEERALFLS